MEVSTIANDGDEPNAKGGFDKFRWQLIRMQLLVTNI